MSPRLLVALTLTTATAWRFPNAFDLEDPEVYYQRVCVPRAPRRLGNWLHRMLRVTPAKKAGGEEDGPEGRVGGGGAACGRGASGFIPRGGCCAEGGRASGGSASGRAARAGSRARRSRGLRGAMMVAKS